MLKKIRVFIEEEEYLVEMEQIDQNLGKNKQKEENDQRSSPGSEETTISEQKVNK